MKTERSRARRPSGTSAQPPPSLGDVATRAGTSSASVSRALNAPTLVSGALRRRVLEAASALGYFPNRSGHALAAGKSGLVGMIVPSDQPLDGPVLNAFRQRLQEAGKALLLETSRGAHDDLECVRRLLSWGVEGVAFTGTGAEAASECLRQRAVPGVLCGAEQPNWACVVFDWPGAGAMLARYLAGLGHRRLAFVAADANSGSPRAVTTGVNDAIATAGFSPPTVLPGTLWQWKWPPMGAHEPSPRPTALLCSDPIQAARVRAWLAEHRVRVPEDLSVVALHESGGQNSSEGADIPSLRGTGITSLRGSAAELGRRTAEYLLEARDGATEASVGLRLQVKLVIRASTGLAPR